MNGEMVSKYQIPFAGKAQFDEKFDFITNSIFHKSNLPQMQGAGHEAVVCYREWSATQQVR
jgi:hypothetical protein